MSNEMIQYAGFWHNAKIYRLNVEAMGLRCPECQSDNCATIAQGTVITRLGSEIMRPPLFADILTCRNCFFTFGFIDTSSA